MNHPFALELIRDHLLDTLHAESMQLLSSASAFRIRTSSAPRNIGVGARWQSIQARRSMQSRGRRRYSDRSDCTGSTRVA
ncbi:MAG TPA: hypothetical protein VGQ30_05530, partial [Gemmatimonadaceae bacterium]|nr:hypothetical protein [Gemmatimonadaceae bacterium]